MQESGLNSFRTIVSEVPSFVDNPVYERKALLCAKNDPKKTMQKR